MESMVYIDKEIDGCELAVTDKAKCISCKDVIAQGTPRLWTWGELKQPPPDEGIVKIKRFICNICAPKLFKTKQKLYMMDITQGVRAQEKLTKQDSIKKKYLNYLKDTNVIIKVRNDEVLRELEKDDR